MLIVIEGIDGGGKTTLQRGLARALRQRGLDVVETKEPTGGPLGRRIRELAKDRASASAGEELRLFHEDRAAHVRDVVRPALARGATVIQDRSFYSTVAYQGERGLDRARILRESLAIAPVPDVLYVVDLPPEIALERIRTARGVTDDFEAVESLGRVRRAFLDVPHPNKVVLDGTQPPAALLARALDVLTPRDRAPATDE